MKDASVIAVIQARMGSTRLPGKMLKLIAGEPLIFHIIERVKRIESVDKIILATTSNPKDDPLVEVAKLLGLQIIRGSEKNVLERFITAIKETGAKIVVRVCGDAPLFDPALVDQQIVLMLKNSVDMALFDCDGEMAQQGVMPVSSRVLQWSQQVAADDPLAYEHVTAYASAHRDQFRTVTVPYDPDLVGLYHLSIDTEDDLVFMRDLYRQLYRPGEIVSLKDALMLINM